MSHMTHFVYAVETWRELVSIVHTYLYIEPLRGLRVPLEDEIRINKSNKNIDTTLHTRKAN